MNLAEQLQKISLFKDVSPQDLDALDDVMVRCTYRAGDVLFRAGDPGDSMFIIQAGRVRIYTEPNENQSLILMHYGPSQIFGEFSLLDNKPRSASAAAETDLDVFMLNRDTLMSFLKDRPQASIAMMVSLSERVRYTTAYVEEIAGWVRRLAAGDYQAAIEDISDTDKNSPIQALVGAFLQMTRNFQQREASLKRQVEELRVQIDQDQRRQQVQNITKSDFFANLKAQAKQLREESTPNE